MQFTETQSCVHVARAVATDFFGDRRRIEDDGLVKTFQSMGRFIIVQNLQKYFEAYADNVKKLRLQDKNITLYTTASNHTFQLTCESVVAAMCGEHRAFMSAPKEPLQCAACNTQFGYYGCFIHDSTNEDEGRWLCESCIEKECEKRKGDLRSSIFHKQVDKLMNKNLVRTIENTSFLFLDK